MTDEQIETKIEHSLDLMDIKLRLMREHIDQIEENSLDCHRSTLTLICILIIFVTVAGLSITFNKKEPKAVELEQVK